jgi:hypothetical protein
MLFAAIALWVIAGINIKTATYGRYSRDIVDLPAHIESVQRFQAKFEGYTVIDVGYNFIIVALEQVLKPTKHSKSKSPIIVYSDYDVIWFEEAMPPLIPGEKIKQWNNYLYNRDNELLQIGIEIEPSTKLTAEKMDEDNKKTNKINQLNQDE